MLDNTQHSKEDVVFFLSSRQINNHDGLSKKDSSRECNEYEVLRVFLLALIPPFLDFSVLF